MAQAAVLIAGGLYPSGSLAQVTERETLNRLAFEDLPVSERPLGDFEPKPYRLGPADLVIGLAASSEWTSNLFATPQAAQSDLILTAGPEARIGLEQARVKLDVRSDVFFDVFLRNPDQNTARYRSIGNILYQPNRQDSLSGGFRVERRREDPIYVDRRPTNDLNYNRLVYVQGRYAHRFNRLSLEGSATRSDVSFESPTLRTEDRRDTELSATARFDASARLKLNSEAFVRQRRFPNSNVLLDGRAQGVRVGGEYQDAIWVVRVSAGALRERFEPARAQEISAWLANLQVLWNVTRLTTFGVTFSRDLEAATQTTAANRTRTAAGFSIDHEYRRYLRLRAEAALFEDDFELAARRDRASKIALSARYQAARNLETSIVAEAIRRSSSEPGVGFSRTQILAQVSRYF